MSAFDAIAFVEQNGLVLASGRGAVPSVADAVAGERIRGSWWGHPKAKEIFRALSAIGESADVLCFRLVGGKITFVHRRLWPALVRLADEIGPERLVAVRQEHTPSGAHRNVLTPFPDWVPRDVGIQARALDVAEARSRLGAAADSLLR